MTDKSVLRPPHIKMVLRSLISGKGDSTQKGTQCTASEESTGVINLI